jgi:RNA polymerase sigma factor (sigma-70 family)
MPVLEQPPDVLRQFCHGNLDAFEALFRSHQGEVYGWIVRIVRDSSAAEDLTVETFWRIHRAHARFDPTRSFGAWARRIATNAALDHLKTARREADLPDDLPSHSLPDPRISEELRQKMGVRSVGFRRNSGSPPRWR